MAIPFLGRFTLQRYRALNDSFGNPFVFALTDRGFFSEVNNLLNAVIYGLVMRRRLFVDQTRFGGLSWTDFFCADLPSASPSPPVDPEWVIHDVHSQHFQTVSAHISAMWKRADKSDIPPLGLSKVDVFGLKRSFANLFCAPSAGRRSIWNRLSPPRFDAIAAESSRAFDLRPGKFVSIHVRRGDKTEGRMGKLGNIVIEGETTPLSVYLDLIREHTREPAALFVIADDHAILDELRSIAPGFRIVSSCPAHHDGYRNPEFQQLAPAQKRAEIRRLLTDVQIASQSALFIGGFKSNLARFVANVHRDPANCFSVDAWKQWTPR